MRKSENFDLNLYEGTDIFNPLTTDVPNYEKIDAQMEKNYNLSVGKATELKTGTVHALTRENADCPMIHFTATSNFTSNDTFTVDGVQVSALLVDGSTLPTNCYIIGSEVICYLKGTLLTFFLSGSVSKDSEKLGGELPSYYAKQVDVEHLETTVNSMSGIVENNSNDIVALNTSLCKLLWSNENTNVNFTKGSQIVLNSGDYDYFIVRFYESVGSKRVVSSNLIKKGDDIYATNIDSANNNLIFYYRFFDRLNNVTFKASLSRVQPQGGSVVENYSYLIPVDIIGFKLV